MTINGSVAITNNSGVNTSTLIDRDAAGFNTITGSVTITNGTGDDGNVILDTNVGGNVTVNNGNGNTSSGIAG